MATQTWLDKLLGKIVRQSGADLPTQPAINFSGSGVSVSDNPTTGATDVTITAGAGAPTYTLTGTSGATTAGDVVCIDPTIAGGTNITRWTPALGLAAGGPLSVVTSSHAPGATGVAVIAPGEQTNACVADLGTSTRGDWVTVSPVGRPVRASLFSGGPVLGFCDANGILTVLPRSSGSKTPFHTWNLLDFGAAADADTTYGMKAGTAGVGTPTDNLSAFNAWKTYALAQGAPGRLVIPEAPIGRAYYTSAKMVLDLPFPVDIEGGGGMATTTLPGTVFVCGNLTEQHGGIQIAHAANGSRVKDLAFVHAQTYAPRTWQSSFAVVQANFSPSAGTWNFHFRGVSGTSGTNEPAWPLCWEQSWRYRTNQKIFVEGVYESAGTVYSSIVPPIVGTYGAAWRYKTTTEGQTGPGVRGRPYVGPAPKWTALGTPASGSYVRPTDPNWNGMYYLVNVPGTFAATEGAPWPTGIGPGSAFTNGTVQLYAVGSCMPRTAGLSVVDGGCTWTLDDTSGQFTGDGTAVYDVIPDIRNISVELNGVGHLENIFTQNWCGHGPAIHGSNDLGTGANTWSADRIRSSLVSGDGFRTAGADAGAGKARHISVTGARGVSIRNDSEVGNEIADCLAEGGGGNQNGRFGYWSIQATSQSAFVNCYTEGGLAPSRIGGNTAVDHKTGSWSFTPDSSFKETGGQAANNTAFTITSSRFGLTWAPNTYVYSGLIVYPTGPNGKAYQVQSTTGNSFTSNAGFEPNWNGHKVNGATFTESGNGAVGTITYQVVGTDTATLQLGSQANADFILQWGAADDGNKLWVLTNQSGGNPWYGLNFQNATNTAMAFSRSDYAGNGNGDTGGGGYATFPYGFRLGSGTLGGAQKFFCAKAVGHGYATTATVGANSGDVVANATPTAVGDTAFTVLLGASTLGVVLVDDVFTGTTPQASIDWVDTSFTSVVTAPKDRVRSFRFSLQTTTSGTNQTLATFGPLTDNAAGCFNCEVKAKRNGNHASYLRADVSGNFGRNNGAAPEAAGSTATIQTWGAENSLVALTLDMTVSGNNVLLRINNPPAYAVDWGVTAQWDEGKS